MIKFKSAKYEGFGKEIPEMSKFDQKGHSTNRKCPFLTLHVELDIRAISPERLQNSEVVGCVILKPIFRFFGLEHRRTSAVWNKRHYPKICGFCNAFLDSMKMSTEISEIRRHMMTAYIFRLCLENIKNV